MSAVSVDVVDSGEGMNTYIGKGCTLTQGRDVR